MGRSWYYGTGPGRDEDRGGERTELDALCDINDAEGYWLNTTIPAIQVQTVVMSMMLVSIRLLVPM